MPASNTHKGTVAIDLHMLVVMTKCNSATVLKSHLITYGM